MSVGNGQIRESRSNLVVREAFARAAIEHPNLVGVRVSSTDDGRVSVLLERCPVPSLGEVLNQGPLTASDSVSMLRDIASAVNALAPHGLVARDLTPDRILLDPVRGALLADPGIPLALVRRASGEADRGRPYRSPEELDGRSIDARSNVYSFGAILFAALLGKPPPGSVRGRRPRRRPAALPSPIAAVIARAMAHDPSDRYSDVDALMHAALAAFGGEDVATSERSQKGPAAAKRDPVDRSRSKAASPESRPRESRSGFALSRLQAVRALARPRPHSTRDEPGMKPLRRSQPDARALLEQEDVEGLVHAVGFQDVEPDAEGHPVDGGMRLREQAVLALGELGPDAGGKAVAGALHDSSDCVRSAAVRVLHSRGEIGLLAKALSSLPPKGEKSRELVFQAVLEHRSSRVARTAARSLVRTPGDAPLSDGEVTFIQSLARSEGGRDPAKVVVRELLKALSDDRSEVAERAEELLVGLGSISVPGVIAELENDRSPERAAIVLGRIGDSGAMEPLIGALEHRHQGVRLQAAAALGALRDPAAVEPLLRATRDSDYDVRAEASHSLDHMGAAGVIVGMSALLRSMVVEAVTSAAELSPPDRARRVVPQISAPPQPWQYGEARDATRLPDDSPGR